MGERFHDILILLSFLIEVAVLFYMEMKAWKTLYTPLNFLMLPYVIVLLITVVASGNFGLVDFHYPSIFIWSIGLLIVAIPSYVMAFILQRNKCQLNTKIAEERFPKILTYASLLILPLFALRLKTMLGGPFAIGSDEFGETFCGFGLWGHLRLLLLPVLMMAIYFVDKKNKWLWLIIIPILVIALLYQVKGWVIVPCLTGIAMRLYSGRTKLKASLVLYVVFGALAIFLGSYVMILVVAGNSEFNANFISAILGHFVHYLTSGTFGLSMDMELGFPDMGEFDMVIAQFVNIGNLLTGEEMITPLNPLYLNPGISETNIRTLFGTVFINSGYYLVFVVYFLFLSSLMYLLKIATIWYNNIYVYTVYFFACSLLFMGWFDSYFALLQAVEIPAFTLVWLTLAKILQKKTKREVCTNEH